MKTTQIMNLAALIALMPMLAFCDGISEPGLMMYGAVRNIYGTNNVKVTTGTLNWTITPSAGGSPVTVSAPLRNINGQFSYMLRVPFETIVGSSAVSPNTFATTASPSTYVRSSVSVTLNGTNYPASISAPALGTFTFKTADRGKIEEVNLQISASAVDSDGDGLPDWWELQYFGTLNWNCASDPDDDGMTNCQEYISGTNPNNASSLLAFTSVSKTSQGTSLTWCSCGLKTYSLQRASFFTEDPTNFTTIATITATTNETSYVDTNAAAPGPYFYRVSVSE